MKRILGALIALTFLAACSTDTDNATDKRPPGSPQTPASQSGNVQSDPGGASPPVGAPATAAAYASPAAVIAALGKAGLTCSGAVPVPVPSSSGSTASSNGARITLCSIGTEQVAVGSFGRAQAGQATALARQSGYTHYVLGSTWIVATKSATTASRVGNALGGTVH